MPPKRRHKPTTPLQMIITAAKTVSRAKSDLSPGAANISETIKAVSITVTARASVNVP